MIKVYDPLDPKKEEKVYEDYFRIGNKIYVKTEFSNCLLELEVRISGTLMCPINGQIVGSLI